MPSSDDDVQYEFNSVQALRGREGSAKAKWQDQGWEFVSENRGTLRTELNFRRVKPKTFGAYLLSFVAACRRVQPKTQLVLVASGALILVAGITGIVVGTQSGGDTPNPSAAQTTASTPPPAVEEKLAAEEKPAPEQEPAVEEEPEMTSGQENALESAQGYLDIKAFSKAGLIGQLSSSAGEGFSKADATFAANHADADWNKEAVESAQGYLDIKGFSKAGLIEQLSSSAGEEFTPAQARYAVSKVY